MCQQVWGVVLAGFQPRKSGSGWLWSDRIVAALILLAVTASVLQTEEAFAVEFAWAFFAIDLLCGLVFSVEYALRVLAAGADPRFSGFGGRLRYIVSPLALLDLAALLPFFFLFATSDSAFLRLFRLLRILALLKSARLFDAFDLVRRAVRARAYELGVSFCLSLLVLLLSSTALYFAERAVQPDAFGSIPRALWASVITLTTVGYGDIYPVTALGRTFAGVTAFVAIALVALPAGILAAAFSDEIQRRSGESGDERGDPSR
jgi:voltage-gated potassium channel